MSSSADLKQQLRRQLDFVRRSAEHYDEGVREEAIRIAVALRVLFHDTRASTSLLTHLGIKQSVKMLTIIPDAYVKIPGTNRVIARLTPAFSPETGFITSFEKLERNELVTVDAWWEQAVLCREDPLTRRDVVLSAANQDGGAHVDPNPSAKTQQLVAGVGSYQPAGTTEEIPLDNVHFALLRQLAFEVLNSPGLIATVG
jgi:hypothetical protein